jgi:hypothetical protein
MNSPPNPNHWLPLIELIPAIERTRQFGAYPEPVQLAENLSAYSGISNSEIAGEFLHRVYESGLMYDFDWMSWDFGKSALQNRFGDNFSHYDLETLNKFIIAIVRNDKYCEGYLVSKFSDGTILSILKVAESIVNHKDSG